MRRLYRMTAVLSLTAILWAAATAAQAARVARVVRPMRPVAAAGVIYMGPHVLAARPLRVRPAVVIGSTRRAPAATWIAGKRWTRAGRVTRRGVIAAYPKLPVVRRALRLR